jgi:predicted O-methyltransferase YrrM
MGVFHKLSRIWRKPIYRQEYPSFSPFDRVALAELIRTAKRQDCLMAEIGCWLGQGSTRVFIEELKGVGRLLCIDTFKGTPNAESHRDLVAHYDVEGTFRYNVDRSGGTDMVEVMTGDAEVVAESVADGALDLVFIDSDHSYSMTRSHIAAWRKKVKRGGVICGHDCEGLPREFDPEVLIANRQRDTIPGNKLFRHVHPGCVLAVSEAFGDRVSLYAHRETRLPDGTPGRSTIWYSVA